MSCQHHEPSSASARLGCHTPSVRLAVMATDYGTGFEVRLGDMRGCVLIENAATVVVETVAEAREAILSYATDALGHHAHDPERREHLRLNVRPGGPTWEDLAECEKGRRYDPADPETGMTCSYLLYLHSRGARRR